MKAARIIALFLTILSGSVNLNSQNITPFDTLLYNTGGIFIDTSAIIRVIGNTVLDGSSNYPFNLLNNGEFYVHFDSVFPLAPKGYTMDNDAVVTGTGYFEIEPDWTNNSKYFFPGLSTVHLMSDLHQKITGTDSSNFFRLILSGNGSTGNNRIKTMTRDVYVQDSLSLTNRELATDSFILAIMNTETTAISFTSTPGNQGFVSSLRGDTRLGSITRRTANSQNPYIFPVGSSVNPPASQPYIYRPVDILPENNNINTYGVRFLHESPDAEGYNQFSLGDSLCSVNPLYYHMVNHPSGFDPARVRFFYDPLSDNVYDYISQWSGGKWNQDKSSQYSGSGSMFSVTVPVLGIFSFDTLPFILSDRIPGVPDVVGDGEVCSDNLAMLTAVGNSKFFTWILPSTMQILSDPDDDTLIMKVGDQSGYIRLSAVSSTGRCEEAADSFLVVVNPGPDAAFTASMTEVYTKRDVDFRDSSLGTPVEWFWNFGDGGTASSPVVSHDYSDVGEYSVVMYVRDENGCTDSSIMLISVIEGISVPNVFSPNGDGKNDLFYVPNSGIKEYYFRIFNRWGAVMFETRAPEIAWDGYTNTGEPAKEGTYYYVLEASSEENEYVLKGYLTLFR